TFNRHADKVAMAAVAQLVNCLQSLFLAHEDKFCLTPTYHVFDMYAAHQGARSVRTLVASPENRYSRNGAPASMRGLNGSASVNGNQLTLTVTNPSMDQPREAEILIHGGTARAVAARIGASLYSVPASARQMTLTVTNPSMDQPREAEIQI